MPLKNIIATTTAIVVLISTILALWFLAEDRLQDTIVESSTNITEMIQRSTLSLVEIHRDDLTVRKRLIKNEMEFLRQKNEHIPRMLMLEHQAVTDQLNELERKQW